jgi:uncharacterized protein YjbI with pentapeptide repeats
MTINAITSNPKILGNLKQAIGTGTGTVENVVSTNENISTENIDNIVNLTLNNDVSITTLDLSNVLLNGNYGLSGEILMSQGLEDNIWAPMPIIPDIPDTLISNSLYVNDNINTIQSKIDISNQADVIYISAGSYGEQQIKIDGKYNIALCAPPIGTSAICEALNGINITNTSELIRVSNLSFKGSDSFINPIGRCIFHNVTFTGSVLDPLDITIGDSTTKYLTFYQCEWNQYCNITIPSTFASIIYFVNCNFSSAVINLLNFSNQQVIFNNCAGFVSFPLATKATLVGLNVLTTGVSRVDATNVNLSTINSLAYPPTISLPAGVLKQFYYVSAQTPTQSAVTIDIGTPVSLSFDITKYYKVTVIYNFNIVVGGGGVSQCTFSLRDNDDTTLQQMEFNLSKPHQTITIIFYVQPLLASSFLYFVASSPDQIENASTDRIIWDIQEIQ